MNRSVLNFSFLITILVCASCASSPQGGTAEGQLTTVGNPYLPLWEHIPDGEPYVFEDPDQPGKYRVYIYGSHDDLKTEYCGRRQPQQLALRRRHPRCRQECQGRTLRLSRHSRCALCARRDIGDRQYGEEDLLSVPQRPDRTTQRTDSKERQARWSVRGVQLEC